MDYMEKAVREFHTKHGYPQDMVLNGPPSLQLQDLAAELHEKAQAIQKMAVDLQEFKADPRLYRAHLMMEELAEVLQALSSADEVSLADGLADLKYVVIGTEVTFGIPGKTVLDEVHRSNMTKRVRQPDDPRMRDKGANYSPPNIARAIVDGRDMRGWRTHEDV